MGTVTRIFMRAVDACMISKDGGECCLSAFGVKEEEGILIAIEFEDNVLYCHLTQQVLTGFFEIFILLFLCYFTGKRKKIN